MKFLTPLALLILAATLEASGDAIMRVGLKPRAVPVQAGLMLTGGIILYFYGLTLNLAPLD